MKKKLLTLFLAICMICTLLPFSALADNATSGKCGDNVTWSFENGTLTISGKGDMYDYSEDDDGNIDSPWANYTDDITSVVVKSGVTYVGQFSFAYCENLKKADIADTVTLMGWVAFKNCSSLEYIELPKNLDYISMQLFENCSSLTSILFPKSCDIIGLKAFYGCTSLKSVTLPSTLREIYDRAFINCPNLKDVYYDGTKADWDKILIDGYNHIYTGVTQDIHNATFHYNTHNYVKSTVDPTCTEKGYTLHECLTCDESNKDTYISALGHNYKDGKCTRCGAKETAVNPVPENPFKDVAKDSYCYEPVLWAYNHDPQVTAGVDKTHFAPDNNCTRAQIVTFLWRANGCPSVKGIKNPFKDVKSSDYYYDAVLWAVSKNITTGIDATHFAPNNTCTRGQAVTFLWRANENPKPVSTKCPFNDVKTSDYYYNAVLWAVGKNITNGVDATHFAPNNTCTRGQIVTFLYRDMK